MSLVWNEPWLPVIPWTIARVCFPIKTANYAATLLTASLAASSILSMAVRPADWSIRLPSSWLVPTIRMTSGFLRPMTFFTSTIPFATSSHLVIPAIILTNTTRTVSYDADFTVQFDEGETVSPSLGLERCDFSADLFGSLLEFGVAEETVVVNYDSEVCGDEPAVLRFDNGIALHELRVINHGQSIKIG